MKQLLSIPVLALFAAMFFSCVPQKEEVKVKEVKVSPAELTLVVEGRETLSVEVIPSDAEYTYAEWSSSDPSVATVNKAGTVTAVKEGTAVITATVNGVSGKCNVTVAKNLTPVKGIRLSASSLTLGQGAAETLTATIDPADAANKNVIWSSTDPKVATVADGLVTAVGAGQCDIVAKSEDGGFEAKCAVTVQEVPVEAVAFSNGSENAVIVEGGSTYTLIVSFTPANTSERDIKWRASDAALATIDASEGQAVVTFAQGRTGAVTITATVGKAQRTASQQFFIQGATAMIVKPEGKVYAGRKAAWKFNTADYPTASNIRWSADGRSFTGETVQIAPVVGGTEQVTVTATFDGTDFTFSESVEVEEWFICEAIDGANPRNTYPVFNNAATRAYFVTRGARRLYEIDLEQGKLGWMFDLNEGKNDNGYQIAVNPNSGDIYCASQYHIYCITPEGTAKWAIEVPNSGSCSAIAGSGPGLSNDCGTVFFPVVDGRFIAVDAASGAILDSFDVNTVHLQFAVYGSDDIVIHTAKQGETPSQIKFTRFDGSKFSEVNTVESNTPGATDITSPAISRDQKTAWFSCEIGGLISANLETKTFSGVMDFTDHKGILMQPVVTDDDKYLFFASAVGSRVNRVIAEMNPTSATQVVRYNHGEQNDWLNFESVAVDTQGNVYFFIKDDGAGNNTFYRIPADGGQPEIIASIPKQNADPQGFFNFGGGFLIGGGGNNTQNRVLVRCIDAERGHGWSGPGGDLCATKNANLVYNTK